MKFTDYIEKKHRGTPDFPIQYYFLDSESPQYVMHAHWHKEFEIIRVISGEFNVFLDNVEYCLHSGDILFVECGCLHRGEPKNSVYECIVFDLNMMRKTQNDVISGYISPIVNGNAGVNCMLDKSDNSLYAAANSLFSALKQKKPFFELDVYSLLYRLFSQLYCSEYIVSVPKMPRGSQAEKISRLLDWIEENFSEPITLKKLSEISGMNEKYLCRVFREYTSKTPISYINDLRIENSCHEMTVIGHSVTEAAYSSGFNDLSYFSKTFKQYKGMTPKEYRSKYLKKFGQ